jgi:hypothetical protein
MMRLTITGRRAGIIGPSARFIFQIVGFALVITARTSHKRNARGLIVVLLSLLLLLAPAMVDGDKHGDVAKAHRSLLSVCLLHGK